MQVRENDVQLLYGLFQSICSWALDKGYKDVSGMKNLLKLAMVDVCQQRHPNNPPIATQMAIVTELGISLRNVQKTQKALNDLRDLASGFVKIRQIQEEIAILLTQRPQTADEILPEVSYLMHAPYDLQKRTLNTILRDMEQKRIIASDTEKGKTYYRTLDAHVNLFDPTNLSARVSGVLQHISAFKNTIGQPFFRVFPLNVVQARGLQAAINEFLRGTGNAYEQECRESKSLTKAFDFYLGSAPVSLLESPITVADVMLEVIRTRFANADSASLARTHWYHLTPACAKTIFAEVCQFIEQEGCSAIPSSTKEETTPFAFYFGMADRQSRISEEEI